MAALSHTVINFDTARAARLRGVILARVLDRLRGELSLVYAALAAGRLQSQLDEARQQLNRLQAKIDTKSGTEEETMRTKTPDELSTELAQIIDELQNTTDQEDTAERGVNSVALLARRGDERAIEQLNRFEASRASAQHRRPRLQAARAAVESELHDALQVAERGQTRERARKARVIIAAARKRGADLDRELQSAVANFLAIERDLSALAELGAGRVSRDLVRVHIDRALRAALMRLPSLNLLLVPPRERRTFSELISGWTSNSDRWADDVLKGPDPAAEASSDLSRAS